MRLALDLIGPTTIVPYGTNDGTKITTGHVDGLAIVEGLDGGQEICVLLQKVGQLQQHATSLVGCCLLPWALECLASSGNGDIYIFLGGLVDLADDLLGGGVDDIELLLVDALDPLAVNVPGREGSLVLY